MQVRREHCKKHRWTRRKTNNSRTCVVFFVDVSVCSCWGDVHCTSFDKLWFDYQGICKFTVVGVNGSAVSSTVRDFSIYSKSEYRYGITAVSWTKYIEIVLDRDVIRLDGNHTSDAALKVTVWVRIIFLSISDNDDNESHVYASFFSNWTVYVRTWNR